MDQPSQRQQRQRSKKRNSAAAIERIVRGDRGFIGYGQPFDCTYGTSVETYESSSAEGPHLWLALQETNLAANGKGVPGQAHAHLNEDQVRALRDRLQAFLDDVPSRWG